MYEQYQRQGVNSSVLFIFNIFRSKNKMINSVCVLYTVRAKHWQNRRCVLVCESPHMDRGWEIDFSIPGAMQNRMKFLELQLNQKNNQTRNVFLYVSLK